MSVSKYLCKIYYAAEILISLHKTSKMSSSIWDRFHKSTLVKSLFFQTDTAFVTHFLLT